MVKKISLILVIILVTIYIVMQISTFSIVTKFYDIFNCNIDQHVEYGELYPTTLETLSSKGTHHAKIKILTCSLHNFRKGIIYGYYSCSAYDVNGNITYGSNCIPTKWYIEKQNGRWIVTHIEEAP